MFFQFFLKGICFDDDTQADRILQETGILCNWWRNSPTGSLPANQIPDRLTEENLLWHLNRYDDPDPREGGQPFQVKTPFISITSGAVERDPSGVNISYPPFLTALDFATRDCTETGYIFYGYVYTLGKQSIPLESFAEEVRELHIYTTYLPHHAEGEITAKIRIPPQCIELYEKFDGPRAQADLQSNQIPTPMIRRTNPLYADPVAFANLRGLID